MGSPVINQDKDLSQTSHILYDNKKNNNVRIYRTYKDTDTYMPYADACISTHTHFRDYILISYFRNHYININKQLYLKY